MIINHTLSRGRELPQSSGDMNSEDSDNRFYPALFTFLAKVVLKNLLEAQARHMQDSDGTAPSPACTLLHSLLLALCFLHRDLGTSVQKSRARFPDFCYFGATKLTLFLFHITRSVTCCTRQAFTPSLYHPHAPVLSLSSWTCEEKDRNND